mmetsp:Transcript_33718/g.24751  ORF Transcript_33718/g.24751 Transcript_33718/m.24751 type:complete len:88 (-) Transcript_33718:1184-1447(-)
MATATLMGSGLFITALITAAITLVMKKSVAVTPPFYVRDVVFYIVCILVFIYALVINQKIDKIVSSVFILLYVVYVGFVIIQNRIVV